MSKESVINLEKLVIRKAIIEDMKEVFTLIQELANYQKLGDQFKLTLEDLENDGFNTSTPAFHCSVAVYENKIVGYVLYFFCYSTFLGKSVFCEDLFVRTECRKFGIGKKLLVELAKVALEHCGRLDFHVISWNPAVAFYERLGATNLSNSEKWALFRLDKDALGKLVADKYK